MKPKKGHNNTHSKTKKRKLLTLYAFFIIMTLQYIICPGNNSQVIKKCMDLRAERWEETYDFDTLFNFRWHPISRGIKFEQVNTHGTR